LDGASVLFGLFRKVDGGIVLVKEEKEDICLKLVERENARNKIVYLYALNLAGGTQVLAEWIFYGQ
jgi:hypothetical protein